MLKKHLIVCLIIFLSIPVYTQITKGQSNLVKLDIKFPPPDTVKPDVTLNLPLVLDNFPIYTRDSIFVLNGNVSDLSSKIKLFINEKDFGIITTGQFIQKISLLNGENSIIIKFVDKTGNSTIKSLFFYYDPNADVSPPALTLDPPFSEMSRGIQIISKDQFESLPAISGRFSDQSNILGIWVNDIRVDSIFHNKFYFPFLGSIPDTVKLKIADVYGNLSIFNAQLEDVPDVGIEPSLEQINYYALIIAINSYSDPRFSDLEGPIRDGQNLIKTLSEDFTFNKANIKFLKNPTRATIIKSFDEYKKKLGENDNLLIFYAGHGKMDEDTETGYWLPSDAYVDNTANWIPNSTIRDYIRGIKTQHTLLISDACFGSSILRDFFPDAEKSIKEIYKVKSRKAIVSGSNDTPDKSVFMEYLLKYLKSIDKPYITAMTLYNRLKEPVISNSKTGQYPEYKAIPFTGDEGYSGDFIFKKLNFTKDKK